MHALNFIIVAHAQSTQQTLLNKNYSEVLSREMWAGLYTATRLRMRSVTEGVSEECSSDL